MIHIVTTVPFPYGYASTKRVQLLAEGMNLYDKSKVLICRRVASAELLSLINERIGISEGVEYEYVINKLEAPKNIIKRKFYEICDLLSLKKYLECKLKRGDFIFIYSRELLLQLLVLRIAKAKQCKCAMDLCELPFGTKSNSLFEKICRKISFRYIFPHYDAIFPISDSLKSLAEEYSPNAVVKKIPILQKHLDKAIPTNTRENILFHAGTINEQKDGMLTIFKALGELKTKRGISIPFFLTGKLCNSAIAADLEKTIKEYGLEDNIKFLGYLSNEEVDSYTEKSMFVIIYKHDNLQNKYCFSTKMGDYMRKGKVILTTRVGEQCNYLQDGVNCFLVEPGNFAQLVEKMEWIMWNNTKLDDIGKNAIETSLRYFDYSKNGKNIVDTLQSL